MNRPKYTRTAGIVFFLILLHLSIPSKGQEIKVTQTAIFNRVYSSEIIGIASNHKQYSIHRHYGTLTLGITDTGLTKVETMVPIPLKYAEDRGDISFRLAYIRNDKIILVGQEIAGGVLYMRRCVLDMEGNVTNKWNTVTQLEATNGDIGVIIHITQSANKQHGCIWVQYTRSHDETFYFKVVKVDKDFNQVWDNKFAHQYDRYTTRLDFLSVDDKGNIYSLISEPHASHTFQSAMFGQELIEYKKDLMFFKASDGEQKIVTLTADSLRLDRLSIFFDSSRAFISGFCSRTGDSWNYLTCTVKGTFPLAHPEELRLNYDEFSPEIKESILYNKEKQGVGNSLQVKDRLQLEGGKTVYVSEYHFSPSDTYRSIFLFCYDSTNTLIWQRAIDRYAFGPGYFFSYGLVCDGHQIGILFIDFFKNFKEGVRVPNERLKSTTTERKAVIVLAKVSAEGTIDYNVLWNTKSDYRAPKFRDYYRLDEYRFIGIETFHSYEESSFHYFRF